MRDLSVLWQRLDQPGHESCRVFFQNSNWLLTGTAVFAHNQQPCRLDYRIVCDSEWRTLSARVGGWVGNQTVEVEISVDSQFRWRLNDVERPEVSGCIDLDLNFSPSTNTLPVRRLGLAIEHEGRFRAACLRFPSFSLEPLEQLYRRLDVETYRYESAGGKFHTDIKVNPAGLVTDYPSFWRLEAAT